MNLTKMSLESSSDHEHKDPDTEFVQVDSSGRYGRYKEVLGKGAYKKVYRAFDELEGIEVAWNQIKVSDFLRNPEELERLYSEVHLLKTLKHKNIIKFYNSWVDTKNEHINFITEIFTSGTLRQYRKKHKHVDLRALKNWSKQILEGLLYLHSHDPPIIHRDLKCDNIFVNGNQGEVKIGDLGLAAILRKARSAHSVIGTPEFMAPELYEEDYNELVDIYAFGMCLLELVTFEYPYAECTNAAQIYKKVTSGVKPASLAEVKDPEVKLFIEKCIANVSGRLSAKELLMDRFLQSDGDYENTKQCTKELDNGETQNESMPDSARDFTMKVQMKDPNAVFLKLHIEDTTGHVRNIHFPFDIKSDTPVAVAREMVEELDLTNQDVSTIAKMIESEIQSCFPDQPLTEYSYSDGQKTLERLPSGRIYWSDAPKNGLSSPKTIPSDVFEESVELLMSCQSGSSAGKTEEFSPEDDSGQSLEVVVEKLKRLMAEQQRELEELKKQHGLIVNDILMKLPPETREEVVSSCNVEILEECVSDKTRKDSDLIFHTKVKDGNPEPRVDNYNPGAFFGHKFKSGIEYPTPGMGIAVILRNDRVSS